MLTTLMAFVTWLEMPYETKLLTHPLLSELITSIVVSEPSVFEGTQNKPHAIEAEFNVVTFP